MVYICSNETVCIPTGDNMIYLINLFDVGVVLQKTMLLYLPKGKQFDCLHLFCHLILGVETGRLLFTVEGGMNPLLLLAF